MNSNSPAIINVRPSNNVNSDGILQFAHTYYKCKLGTGGIRSGKLEGDGVTPVGSYRLLYGYYRADRIRRPISILPMLPINKSDGWCDDTQSPRYNSPISLPTKLRHEKLWRKDHLYDICLVLDYNLYPRTQNRGSAIFFHLVSPNQNPTQGCVAIGRVQMLKLLGRISANTFMTIHH